MWKRKLYYLFPPSMRYFIRRIYFLPIDIFEKLSGKRDEITPPKGMIFIGPGDFKKMGEHLVKLCKDYGGLKPNNKVLDIGCGIGRLAIPLTKYISKEGSYDGFDIVKKGIDWCDRKITPRFPNFKFVHTPLKNDLYNLSAQNEAANFTFPYPDNRFDFVVLTSVFTHMQEADMINYLKEIYRVMKNGGTCFVTFFIISEESEAFLNNSENPFFKHKYDTFYLHDKNVKDANIAYKIDFLENNINEIGLTIENFHPGWWAGKDKNECLDFQDILILGK